LSLSFTFGLSFRCSDVEEHLSWVLNALLDLSEEEDSLSAVDDAMVIGQGDVHDWTSLNLAASDNGAHLGGVHAEDSGLRHVDDRSSHHGAEDATVGDGEGATGKVFQSNLAVTSLQGQVA